MAAIVNNGAAPLGPTAMYQERKDDYEGDRLPAQGGLSSSQPAGSYPGSRSTT